MADRSFPRLNLVVIRSADIERTVAFYRRLGLGLIHHAHGSGPMHYAAEADGFVFEIYPTSAKSHPTIGTRLGFAVASVDELVVALKESGATILTSPADSEWGRRAVVKDPDGHTVELTQPA
jgi:catechol 2,3-dioxygenase-like lactoylglutathione lyase family enzyme